MIFKTRWKKKKTLLQWIFQNIIENQAFQRTAKFIETKSIVVLFKVLDKVFVKVDEMYNILKSLLAERWRSWILDIGREMKVLDDQNFLLEPLIRPCFIMGAGFIFFPRFRITFFSKIQIINVILSSLCSICSKRMTFQHVLSLWELQHITHMKQKSDFYWCLYLHKNQIFLTIYKNIKRERFRKTASCLVLEITSWFKQDVVLRNRFRFAFFISSCYFI